MIVDVSCISKEGSSDRLNSIPTSMKTTLLDHSMDPKKSTTQVHDCTMYEIFDVIEKKVARERSHVFATFCIRDREIAIFNLCCVHSIEIMCDSVMVTHWPLDTSSVDTVCTCPMISSFEAFPRNILPMATSNQTSSGLWRDIRTAIVFWRRQRGGAYTAGVVSNPIQGQSKYNNRTNQK